jgi:hypothetical protein
MNLETVFNQLRTGELSQLFLGEVNPATGEFTDEKKEQLIQHISLGLTALHRRFNIKQGRIVIERVMGQEKYLLDKKYSESNDQSKEPVRYIKDLMLPFTNDLLKITQVLDSKGCELKLNEVGNPESVLTPAHNVLIIPEALNSPTLQVVYRANHKPLEGDMLYYPPAYVPIELPDVYLEPLLYFIASRAHNPVGMDNSFHAGNNWAALYEKTCQEISSLNYELETNHRNDRFHRNGWV